MSNADVALTCHFYQERLPLEEVFEELKTSRAGLSSDDAEIRLQIFGPNKLEEKPVFSQPCILYIISSQKPYVYSSTR